MKKALLLSVVASTMIMAGGDIAPVEPVVEAPVVEASGWDFSGQAVLYYQTRDVWGAGDLFDQDSSIANAGLQLRAVNKDLFAGIGFGAEISALGTLGLDEDVVSGVPQFAEAGELNSAALTQLYMTYGFGNTSIKVGRQQLPKALSPFAFSEGWNVFKNTFEAALIVNTDITDTTLVYAYVTGSNGVMNNGYRTSLGDFEEINDDGVHMLTAQNKSIEGLTLTGTWYYAPDMAVTDDINVLWGDAKFAISDFTIGLQGGTVMSDAFNDDTTAFGAKVGGNFGMFDASIAYSSVDDGDVPIHNLGTGVKTPLYTQMIFNQNSIKLDSDTIVVRAGVKALGGKFGIAYNFSDLGAAALAPVTGASGAGAGEYQELDLTYKTKVFNDSTTLFAGYVYQDMAYDSANLADVDQNMLRFWARYNF